MSMPTVWTGHPADYYATRRAIAKARRGFRQIANSMQAFGIAARNASDALAVLSPFLVSNRARSRALRGTFSPVPTKPSAKRRYGR